ncbi:MAG: peptide chain release factor N(5)-glutamine methyltransferase [Prolixibacteraceae bacterium]|nr:peptide chain release factor N(5)-glutamine methyltransferase [Prolixibacteraceae bacterium]MBN2773050.1 peptide chain release factor N(5)-glutamine methyltransferase [Prolixibacteraceae bacterium]
MQPTIGFIKKELKGIYPETEVQGFIRLIMEKVAGMNYTDLALKKFDSLEESEIIEIEKIVSRLKKYEPIQYILGETEFYGLKFKVGPSVLIPRPETEGLVDWVLKSGLNMNISILDVGTGSGCIAVSLKKMRNDFLISGIDISEKAIEVAKENAKLNEVELNFLVDDILNPGKIREKFFDVIISNPPYVREREKSRMDENVLNYEPETALFVPDSDFLKFHRAVTSFASLNLKNGGTLFFEINEVLGKEVADLLEKDYEQVEIRKDINGKFRMVKARKL